MKAYMNKILLALTLAVALASLSRCTTSTQFGQCVGIADEKTPELVYKLDVWNAVLGILFVETIVVPIVVLANDTYCPVAKR
jgi:hypothetical protein